MASPRTRHAQGLFAGLPQRYDRMAEALSFFQYGRWRRFMVSRVPPAASVLDVATGTGLVALDLVRLRGARVVTGLDQNEPMIRGGLGQARAGRPDVRIRFVLGQGECLPFADGVFDALTFTYLLRYVEDPQAVLCELARVVKPGGTIACVEFFAPPAPVWRAAWLVYTRLVLPAAGRLGGRSWFDVGRFLGPSISRFYGRYPLPDQIVWWRSAGVRQIGVRMMSLGGGIVIWGTKST